MSDEFGGAISTTRPSTLAFLVECYWPGVTAEVATAAVRAINRACSALTADGVKARVIQSALMPADEAVLLWLEADSEETIARVCRQAEVAYDRATVVVPLGGG